MKKVFNQTCGKWFDTCGKRKTYLTRLQAGGLIFVVTEKGFDQSCGKWFDSCGNRKEI